jgi:hypothetical protein
MSLSLNYPTISPSLLLDFANSGRLDPRVTFSRASNATYFDSAGVLQSAANDAPRFDYNPATLAAQGLLIEESRTNSIRNNTMQGAVAGTPGTLPTNWTYGQLSTLSTEIVGSGTETGVSYVDIRFFGTATTTALVYFEANSTIAATNAQTWAESFYVKQVAGTQSNTSNFNPSLRMSSSVGTNLGFVPGTDITLPASSAQLSACRFSSSVTTNDVLTAFVMPALAFNAAGAIDITLRIGLPQLELGAFATSVIPTTTTALTRAADVASVNTLSPWFNASEGTLFAEVQRYALIPSGAFYNAWSISDNTNNERFIGYNTGSTQGMDASVTDGGSPQTTLFAPGTITANTTIKTALAYAVNDFAFVRDAGVVQTDTSGTLPTVSRLYIGANSIGTGQWTSYIRRITYYPRKLSSAELQAITA